jgi:hypothetical protein
VTPSAIDVANCFAGQSWALGDCDTDGILNGVDGAPCDGTLRGTIASVPSPFCLPGRICEGTSNVCAPFLRCSSSDTCVGTASVIGATGPWECSVLPGITSTFCHPSCDATAHCNGTTDCGSGSCLPVSGSLSMCSPSAVTTCASSCIADPLDWSTAQGDCDGDGAQNGCDPSPCRAGDSPCAYNHVCVVDAGVRTLDASVPDAASAPDAGNVPDAGTGPDDASSSQIDAAPPDDASTLPMDASTQPSDGGGNVAMDATGPGETTPGLGFGGGGGCRCGVAGGRQRGDAEGYFALGIVIAVLSRSRRVTRR